MFCLFSYLPVYIDHLHIQDLRNRLSMFGQESLSEEYFTVHNWANWGYMWIKVLLFNFTCTGYVYEEACIHIYAVQVTNAYAQQPIVK